MGLQAGLPSKQGQRNPASDSFTVFCFISTPFLEKLFFFPSGSLNLDWKRAVQKTPMEHFLGSGFGNSLKSKYFQCISKHINKVSKQVLSQF